MWRQLLEPLSESREVGWATIVDAATRIHPFAAMRMSVTSSSPGHWHRRQLENALRDVAIPLRDALRSALNAGVGSTLALTVHDGDLPLIRVVDHNVYDVAPTRLALIDLVGEASIKMFLLTPEVRECCRDLAWVADELGANR